MIYRIVVYLLLSSVDPNRSVNSLPGRTTMLLSSKCPFLATEMVQKNSRLVRKASKELQEDVEDVQPFHASKQTHNQLHTHTVSQLYKSWKAIVLLRRTQLIFKVCSKLLWYIDLGRQRQHRDINKTFETTISASVSPVKGSPAWR